MSRKNAIKFILVSPDAVYGAGATRSEALESSLEWIDPPTTIQQIEEAIENGEYSIIEQGREEKEGDFDFYLETQGCFKRINGEWFWE